MKDIKVCSYVCMHKPTVIPLKDIIANESATEEERFLAKVAEDGYQYVKIIIASVCMHVNKMISYIYYRFPVQSMVISNNGTLLNAVNANELLDYSESSSFSDMLIP